MSLGPMSTGPLGLSLFSLVNNPPVSSAYLFSSTSGPLKPSLKQRPLPRPRGSTPAGPLLSGPDVCVCACVCIYLFIVPFVLLDKSVIAGTVVFFSFS